jgi:hypothetical protein
MAEAKYHVIYGNNRSEHKKHFQFIVDEPFSKIAQIYSGQIKLIAIA